MPPLALHDRSVILSGRPPTAVRKWVIFTIQHQAWIDRETEEHPMTTHKVGYLIGSLAKAVNQSKACEGFGSARPA